ncbi:MAG: hypothetical protein QG593_544 [Patescibacteria group bacterium]|jgi:hypothetical protein|nr:hypothetical protein [Patescibacteria group bacterium]
MSFENTTSDTFTDNVQDWIGDQLTAGARFAAESSPFNMQVKSVLRKPSQSGFSKIAESVDGMLPIDDAYHEHFEDSSYLHASTAGSLAVAIDKIKVKTLGFESDTQVSNALTTYITGRLAMQAAIESYGQASADDLKHHFSSFGTSAVEVLKRDIPGYSWVALKLENFFADANSDVQILRRLDNAEVLDEKETTSLGEANDNLWQASKLLQKYGVKPVVAPAIDRRFANQWLFESPYQNSEAAVTALKQLFGGSLPAAIIMGSEIDFRSSKLEKTTYTGNRSGTQFVMKEISKLFGENAYDSDAMQLCVTADGHLASLTGVRLDSIATQTNASGAYEQLRGELLALYFDMVTPVYIDDLVTSAVEEMHIEQPDTRGKLRSLILAREKIMRVLGDDIIDAIEDELVNGAHRITVEHDVIGHVRTIRPTFQASQEARDRCFEDIGVVLADYGETYVRNHSRGSVKEDEERGHIGVFKNGETVNRKPQHNGRTTQKGHRGNKRPTKNRQKR